MVELIKFMGMLDTFFKINISAFGFTFSIGQMTACLFTFGSFLGFVRILTIGEDE